MRKKSVRKFLAATLVCNMIFTASEYEHAKNRVESMTVKQLQTRLGRMTVNKKLAAFEEALRDKILTTCVGSEPAKLQGYLHIYLDCHNKRVGTDHLVVGFPFLEFDDLKNSSWDKPTTDFLIAAKWLNPHVEQTSYYRQLQVAADMEAQVGDSMKYDHRLQRFRPSKAISARPPRRALDL